MPLQRLFLSLLLICFCGMAAAAQVREVQGVVRDAQTREALPFVSITANNGETGTTTNLDGGYTLRHNRPIHTLRFSYVGYTTQEISPDSANVINIFLRPSSAQLQEVVVFGSGENPAHRIIRLANQNREQHRLENLQAYTYRTYNKFILTATDPNEQDMRDTLRLEPQDSSYLRMRQLLSKQHLFLLESVTDYAFLQPNLTKETILATRVSGLQQPSFGIVAAEARDFSVYDDMPLFFGKRYLSPISTGSTRKYDFVLQETNVLGQDTVYVISFKPMEGKNFDGLQGLLYINSNGWAVQNVLAKSAANDKRGVQLQQQYQQVGPQRQWFPTELDVEITVPQIEWKGHQPYAHLRTYITNINLNPALRKSNFSVIALQQKPDAHLQPDSYFQRFRPDSLTAFELRTYQQLDSVGKAQKMDQTIRIVEYLTAQQIPFGPISLDLNRLLRLSDFEGLRLGIGAHTNDRLSERLNFGGYWGYGFKDEQAKYGADASVVLYKPATLQLKAVYFEDVLEPGGIRLPFRQQRSLLGNVRPAVLPALDYTTHYSAALSGRLLRYGQAQAMLRQEQRRPTFAFSSTEMPQPVCNLTEAVMSFRYAYGEKFMQQFNQLMLMPSEYPVLWLQYTRGLDGLLEGDYGYNKYDVRAEASFRHRTFGESRFILAGGLVKGTAPFVSLYNGYGSYNPDYYVYAGDGFETMAPYEFFSDRYAALFFSQNLGKRLLRTGFFKPDVVLLTNIGFGDLHQSLQEVLPQDATFQTMQQGFFESGLLLNNIISTPFSGIGVGAIYRYGPYALNEVKDNLKIKLTLSLAF
ncbi:DUF5686 and carboxypeptidase regulatory-like domain-containing protein [Pontibacter sp. E15-1]|uniref:DUF5686 and carboxypeptidase-like regulatory domain-containing protein n=1 Tax=Pontibacter sp. E15-1 TaxID=2919918 RepID=UPI001F4F35D0|nr:DUF5686 and carboxypeptidase-like regulatory domain-containing protein [Pontibacter sp. E15-1]MCJ8166123.1 DUF5686 and carboxypeptidase regulatory-like domain-containing protein [Pontibacter sp. E15-1]